MTSGGAARVTVRVDDSALRRYTTTPGGPVMGWLVTVANRVMNNSAARVNVDTGYLRSTRTIREDPARSAVQVQYRARYAIYVHARNAYLEDALREEVARL